MLESKGKIPSLRIEYGIGIDWSSFPEFAKTIEGVPLEIESLRFYRERRSHRGISRLSRLRLLIAGGVNQECLEEISELSRIETLYLEQLTATDLGCLRRLRNLRQLIISGGTKIPTLSWLAELPPLRALALGNLKRVTDISAIEVLPSLRAFGFEGSMWTTQRVDSLEPLISLRNLEALFLTSCRTRENGLRPLHKIGSLRYLECAASYRDDEFLALRRANPRLECQWFNAIDKYGSTRAMIKATVAASRAPKNRED